MNPTDTARRRALLDEINAGLPDLDWKAGARRYVEGFYERYTEAQVAQFIGAKPLSPITPDQPAETLTESVGYLNNFANAIQLLALPRGARILDVACGGGWVSHWLAKLGYLPLGLDISGEFVRLAEARMRADTFLETPPGQIEASFRVHDLEAGPLPAGFDGAFDAAVLESCLHHFHDPIQALENLGRALADDGLMLIIEGENRQGPIRDEYMRVMVETETLERPYPREVLTRLLSEAGLPHFVFLGAINGFFLDGPSAMSDVAARFNESAKGANLCVCAKTPQALRRIAPSYGDPSVAVVSPVQDRARRSRLAELGGVAKRVSPAWMHPALRAAWRLLRP